MINSRLLPYFAGVGLCFYLALKIVFEPLALPVLILAAVLITVYITNSWPTFVMGISGLVLCAASWPATDAWGVWSGRTLSGLGAVFFLSQTTSPSLTKEG